MINLALLKVSVKCNIDEILRHISRIEAEESMDIRENLSSILWFEIFGMQRIIKSLEWQLSTITPLAVKQEAGRDMKEIQDMLTDALNQSEYLFEKVQQQKEERRISRGIVITQH